MLIASACATGTVQGTEKAEEAGEDGVVAYLGRRGHCSTLLVHAFDALRDGLLTNQTDDNDIEPTNIIAWQEMYSAIKMEVEQQISIQYNRCLR